MVLEQFDIYGTSFAFTTFKKEKFKTNFGAILSILSAIVMLVTTILFGKDFFNKINPKIIAQKMVPTNYTEVRLTNRNFVFAWRFEDLDGNKVDIGHVVYPRIALYRFKKSAKGEWETTEKIPYKVEKCTPYHINDTRFTSNYNLEDYYCLDHDSAKTVMGGFWDGTFCNKIAFDIFACENDNPDGNCTDLQTLKNNMNLLNQLYFAIYYPSFYFDPTDQEEPLKIQYLTYYNTLNANLIKTDRIFLTQPKVSDDRGWIFTDYKEYSAVTNGPRTLNNVDFKTDSEYGNPKISSKIYTMAIFLEKDYEYYTRSYMKIQDLAATVGGFMKLISILSLSLTGYYNKFSRNQLLINEIFDFQSPQSKNISMSINKTFDNSIMKLQSQTKQQNYFRNSEVVNSVSARPEDTTKTRNMDLPLNLPITNTSFKKSYNKTSIKGKKFKLTLLDSIKLFLCSFNKKFNNASRHTPLALYNKATEYLNQKLDIKYYVKNMNLIKKFIFLFLNKDQYFALHKSKKINLHLDNEIEIIDPKARSSAMSMYAYFKRLEMEGAGEIDKKLFEILKNSHKEKILQK
jgi:hypothetical protein